MKRRLHRATGHLSRTQLLIIVALLVLIGASAAAILLERSPEPRPPIEAPRAEPRPDSGATSPEAALRALPEREQLALAFEAAFGRRDSASIAVTGDDPELSEQVEFRPGMLLWPEFGPALVSEGEVIEAAHVSSGKIAVHYLRPAVGSFEVARSFVPAIETGSFGRVGSWRISEDFSDDPVIHVEGGGTWQGYSCSYATLVELTPEGVVELARFPTHYSDAGAVVTGRPTEIKGEVTNIVKGKSFDVSYSGSRSWTEHYERRDNAFVMTGGQPQLQEC